MRIAEGIEMLEITAEVMGSRDTLYPVLLYDDNGAMLVDTGYPGLAGTFGEACVKAGVPLSRVDTILITHQDLDHIGSLPVLVQESGGRIRVLAHPAEQPYIEGDQMLLKHSPEAISAAEAMLPPSVPEQWRKAFLHILAHPPKAKVDGNVTDGDLLPIAGGVTVIGTPGHSPGHVALYHRASRTLIAVDSLTVRNGELHGPDPRATPDMDTALASLRKYAAFDIGRVICYHGGLHEGDAAGRIAELAEGRA